jgi:hypothetical protein
VARQSSLGLSSTQRLHKCGTLLCLTDYLVFGLRLWHSSKATFPASKAPLCCPTVSLRSTRSDDASFANSSTPTSSQPADVGAGGGIGPRARLSAQSFTRWRWDGEEPGWSHRLLHVVHDVVLAGSTAVQPTRSALGRWLSPATVQPRVLLVVRQLLPRHVAG